MSEQAICTSVITSNPSRISLIPSPYLTTHSLLFIFLSHFPIYLEIRTTLRVKNSESPVLQSYGKGSESELSFNLLYVLHYCHVLVPNFGGQSIRVWLEVWTKEENLGRTMSQEELIFELPNHYRSSYILIVWE